jgi:hypothetical protein
MVKELEPQTLGEFEFVEGGGKATIQDARGLGKRFH